jgi:hypothetical protein
MYSICICACTYIHNCIFVYIYTFYYSRFAPLILIVLPLPQKKGVVAKSKTAPSDLSYTGTQKNIKNTKMNFNFISNIKNNYFLNLTLYQNMGLILITWIASLSIWLWRAYSLEFLGLNSFLSIWFAGIIFHVVNVGILIIIILYSKYEKIKKIEKK